MTENIYNNRGKTFIEAIRPRGSYKVYKSNILAQAQGGLSEEEKRIFDYCLTFIKKGDLYDKDKIYRTSIKEIVETIGNKSGGSSAEYIAKTLVKIKSKATVLVPESKERNGSIIKGYEVVSAFRKMTIWENREIDFSFDEALAPFLYELSDGNFYGEELSKLLGIRSKYAKTIYELYMAKRYGNNRVTVVEGSLEEWYLWVLGSEVMESPDLLKKWTAGRFRDKVLNVAKAKIEELFPLTMEITPQKKGRHVVAFSIRFVMATSTELLSIDEIIKKKKEELELEKLHEEEYMEKITEYCIANNMTPLEGAAYLKDQGEIEFIPSKLLPEKYKKQ
ncbi:replication initiation protein [Streptococcus sp. DTU_2020_1000888_1_SI_GRL_NUU_041A]|jgi:putative repB protein|uniref:replication initiation protein n=1 Tax=Streptococcus sp. DTU_2020_1000888_1_SI_GRL_NUU_041A TaxID=3077723 RepID=UPI0028E48F62|nr:replication initiation protein [Streptococcus sp. DTU_2020_1000888_1_SI_GRL_NUU_041A]WNU96061.1 replication initiation protein [Streptococcus sp. DTU_2020_1000888_1_SI_GRL_NUU_041A]